jgi:PKD repeat protein
LFSNEIEIRAIICTDFLFLLNNFLSVELRVFSKLMIFLAVCQFCSVSLWANNSASCYRSTEGTNFWFGFMESRNYIESHNVKIIVAASETTNFTISIGPDGNQFNNSYTVFANISLEVTIPWQLAEATGSENIQDKGINLVAEKPVNVYALSWDRFSSDIAVIYPVDNLGTEYLAMCYYPNIDPRNPESGSGRNSEFLIVASENQTRVEITPSKVTDNLIPKDSTFVVYLNKGEVFQVQSENTMGTDMSGQGDLTGSHVISDKPVAFFSGALATTVPNESCCWDHLFEQIPPVYSWGREYFTVPFKSREKDIYRILAAEDNTTLRISGEQVIQLNKGEFYEFELGQNKQSQIFADKRILAAQYGLSHDEDSTFTEGNGDPFLLILNSTEQWVDEVAFVNFNPPVEENDTIYFGIRNHFVNIIAQSNDVPGITLDGESIQSEFNSFPWGNYSYAQIETSPGDHVLQSDIDGNGFLAYVYGFGKWESYGYSAGFNSNLILDLGENIEFFEKDTLLLCNGDTLILDVGPQFDSYLWSTGEVSRKIEISEKGWVWVNASTLDGCDLVDSVYVFKSSPDTNIDKEFDRGCAPYAVLLDAGDGFEKYVWQNEWNDTLSTNREFLADKTGEYRITATNNYRCNARDTFSLVVNPVPDVEISGNHLVCGVDTSNLFVSISGTADSIWNYPGSHSWFSNSNDLLLNGQSQKSVKVQALKNGDYEIFYQLKTIDNCETVDTFKIRFHPQPVSDFVFEDDLICNGYSKRLVYTGSATDSAFFSWDLDGVSFVDTLNSQMRIYNISVGIEQEQQPVISLIIDDNGCVSNEMEKILNSNPNFTMNADKRRGCDSILVNFTGEILTTDNVEYSWTFDDLDTSNQKNVAMIYSEPGFYKVNLTITNPLTLCKNSFTIDSMIKIFPTPVAEISIDPTICYPDSVLIFYTNSLDSSLCKWELDGVSQLGTGNDSINIIIENPIGNVKLTVNEYGCVSAMAEKDIKRKPSFDFVVESEEGCQPYLVEVLAITPDNYIDFTWITDSLPYPGGESNIYLLPDTGRFDVVLAAYSNETGCADTLFKNEWIWVHRNPYAKFEVDYPVALIDNATITFINYSERAVKYLWDLGDSTITDDFEPVHTYTELGLYHPKLYVESEYGCRDTFGLDIDIIPSVIYSPNAFRPDSDIQENRTFMPVGAGVDEDRFEFKIFNRWGELIYETNSLFNPWDGTLKNGGNAPPGNYVWIASYYDIQGFKHNEKGQIMLIR